MGQTSATHSRGTQPATRPKVAYVVGAGRSGSTILGVTLGNCANIFYAGELDKWLMRAGHPKREDAERQAFWRAVRDTVAGADELFGREAHEYLERSSALFRVRGRAKRRQMRPRYLRVTEELLLAISRAANVTHVVDTGHYPLRARELQRIEGIDLYLIFLIRDPRSIVASFEREDVPEARFGTVKTNAYLWLTYLLSLWVFLRHPRERRVLLRHEDLLTDPENVLRELLQSLNSIADLPDLSALSTGFPIQGNRLIQQDTVKLESRQLTPPRSWITTLLQLPWVPVFALLGPVAEPSTGEAGR